MATLVDLSQIIMSTIYMGDVTDCAKNPSIDSKNMIKHSVFNSIRSNNMLHRGNYGQMILACDAGSWRRDFFPQYKHSRRVKREADTSGIKWDFVNEIKSEIYTEIDKYFPMPILNIPSCEGDDIIGVLTRYITENSEPVQDVLGFTEKEKILIVSSDKDNFQLHALGKHIRQWSPAEKKLVKPDVKPSHSLMEKIVKGDSGDGVPNIKMGPDTFVLGIRQKPISTKYLNEFYDAPDPRVICSSPEEWNNFVRNRTLVSYEYIPAPIQESIILCYNEQIGKKHSRMDFMNYLTSNRMSNLLNNVLDFY